jgi:hypothetical protein
MYISCYVTIYFFRFTKNTFYVEKNPTIVNFPIRGIEFGDMLKPEMKVKYPKGATYDLVANVVHEGQPTNGKYKVHILHKGKKIKSIIAILYIFRITSIQYSQNYDYSNFKKR